MFILYYYKFSHKNFISSHLRTYYNKSKLKYKIFHNFSLKFISSFVSRNKLNSVTASHSDTPRNIVFFGNDNFSLVSLQSLLHEKKA